MAIETNNLLALGTVCSLKGNAKTVMIVSRGVVLNKPGDEHEYYDYGACMFPEGIIDSSLVYFNNGSIEQVIATGYENAASRDIEEKIVQKFAASGLKHGNPKPITQKDIDAAKQREGDK
jgi:hypothetical protein